MPKSILGRAGEDDARYRTLWFVCPGCLEMPKNGSGLHMLPVNTTKRTPQWSFNGDLEFPTLSPSILTRYEVTNEDGTKTTHVCHSFLKNGVFEFLSDCTHSLASQHVPMPDLPEWITKEKETNE